MLVRTTLRENFRNVKFWRSSWCLLTENLAHHGSKTGQEFVSSNFTSTPCVDEAWALVRGMPFPTVRGLLATNIDRHATGGRNMLLSMKGVPFGELGFKCGRVRKAVFSQKSLALKTGYPDSASCVTVAWWNYITDF